MELEHHDSSIFGCLCTVCVCRTAKLIICSFGCMTTQCIRMKAKLLNVSGNSASSKTNLMGKRKLHKQHCSKANVPCCFLSATLEFVHGHTHLLPLRRLENPSRENLDFHFHSQQQSGVGGDRLQYWCPPGDQMNHTSASPIALYMHERTVT